MLKFSAIYYKNYKRMFVRGSLKKNIFVVHNKHQMSKRLSYLRGQIPGKEYSENEADKYFSVFTFTRSMNITKDLCFVNNTFYFIPKTTSSREEKCYRSDFKHRYSLNHTGDFNSFKIIHLRLYFIICKTKSLRVELGVILSQWSFQ